MPRVNGKLVPDYKYVDGLRVQSSFSDHAVLDAINHKPKPGDTFVATFPKSGTTFAQQIVLLLLNDCQPYDNAKGFLSKCPYLEMTGLDALSTTEGPRFAKTHLPFDLVPYSPEAKYVVIVRNPKDCLVSFFHHTRTAFYDFVDGTFDDYFDLFMEGGNDYGDYFDHVLSWYGHRNDPNVLFLYYERMRSDIVETIRRIATFLGPKYEAQLAGETNKMAAVVKYSSFEYMKKNVDADNSVFWEKCLNSAKDVDSLPLPSGLKHIVGYLRRNKVTGMSDFKLVRKGLVGNWKARFSEEQRSRMDRKIEERLKGTEMYDFWKSIGCL